MSPALVLKPGREKSLSRHHPWVFSGAVARIEGGPASGDTVEIRAATGKTLAQAAYSPRSRIRARAWSFDPGETVDEAFLRARIARALGLRAQLAAARHTNAC